MPTTLYTHSFYFVLHLITVPVMISILLEAKGYTGVADTYFYQVSL